MPVSGLMLTLSESPLERTRALASLGQEPRLELGEIAGDRLPVVTDTHSVDEQRAL